MCEPSESARWYVASSTDQSIELGMRPDVGAWRLRTPVSDLIGRIDGDACIGLEKALQQALFDAERGHHDLVVRQLRELAATLEDDYLS